VTRPITSGKLFRSQKIIYWKRYLFMPNQGDTNLLKVFASRRATASFAERFSAAIKSLRELHRFHEDRNHIVFGLTSCFSIFD